MDNPERVTYFAATDARGKRVPFGIKAKDRAKHMYIIGKTGMGKSTLLENLAIQDIRNGEGLGFIDPHGGTADKLIDYIPQDRINDVVYFAPFDMEHPIAFNVMEDVGYDKRHLVVSGLMATFKKIWVDAWSARMEYILTNTLLALLEYPDSTLLGVNRMYTDKAYRTKVIDNVKDPVVKDFWLKEFANYGDRYTQEATPAIQNKIGQFTGNPLIRNIIGQPKSSFDIREMMDNKKILIMNLSKGLVGETNMRLLGSMLTTRIFLAAMSRAELSGSEINKLPSYYFYVDEFQNFANETFAEILSEARKYKLNLTMAHQYVEQMEEEVRDAVFGNVGTTVAFRVGPFDAETLETVFMPTFTKEDLVNLGFAQVYLTLMIDGVGSPPFSAVTLPPIEPPPQSYRKEVLEASRKRFAAPRAGIETAIVQELMDSAESEAPMDARMRRRPPGRPMQQRSDAPMRRVLSEQGQEVQGPPPAQAREFRPREESAPPRRERDFQDERPPRPQRDFQEQRPPRPERDFQSERPPRPQYENRPPRPEMATPQPQQKSAEDLKAILRKMTSELGKEREKKEDNKQQNLKGALANVIGKNPPAPEVPVQKPAAPVQNTAPQRNEQPQRPPPPPPREQPVQERKPFEIPEEKLRSVLKGDT